MLWKLILCILSAFLVNADTIKNKKHFLSVCAVFKNEAKYLKEWIEYHRLIGVDHFYLYDCGSIDRPNAILKPYIRKGIVTYVQWPEIIKDETRMPAWIIGVLSTAYQNAVIVHGVNDSKWICFLDINEFLAPVTSTDIRELLEEYEEYPGIILKHECFNAGDLNGCSGNCLVIQSFRLTEEIKEPNYKKVEKMIVKPDQCSFFNCCPFKCIFRDNLLPLQVPREIMRVHKYLYRNVLASCVDQIKESIPIKRGHFPDEAQKFLEYGYEIEDDEKVMKRFVPNVMNRIFDSSSFSLESLPNIKLVEQAIDYKEKVIKSSNNLGK